MKVTEKTLKKPYFTALLRFVLLDKSRLEKQSQLTTLDLSKYREPRVSEYKTHFKIWES